MKGLTQKSIRGGFIAWTVFAGFAATLIAVPQPQPARAQDPVTIGLIGLGAKLLVGDILDDAEKKAQNTIDRAQQAGDLVVVHAGNELQLMIANLRVMLGDLQKKTFEDLTLEQQKLFINLNSSLARVEKLAGEVRPMSELILLDVRQMVERTVLVLDKQDFYISSIRGTTLAVQDHEYRITVTGLGLSFPGNEPRCVVDALLDGKELDPFGSITREENNRITVKIPAKQLNAFFKEDTVAMVPFAIRSTITKGKESKTHQVGVHLVLLPRCAGHFEAEEVVETKKWSDKTETHTITMTHPVDGIKKYVDSWTCAENQRIVGVDYDEANHPHAGWCYNSRKGGYTADFDIVDGGKKAVVYREMQVRGLVCHYHVRYQTETLAFEKVSKGKLTLKFDEPFELDLSPTNRDGNFKISGRLTSGQKIVLTSGTAQADKDNPLRLIGSERTGDHIRLTFKLVKAP